MQTTQANIRTILGYQPIQVIVFENANGRILANKIPGCKPHSYTVEFTNGTSCVLSCKKYAMETLK